MEKKFERALLLSPAQYSLSRSLHDILAVIAGEVKIMDIRDSISSRDRRLNSQIFRFPHAVRKHWESHFLSKVNRVVLEMIEGYSPDLVMIYNSEYLVPETCSAIRQKARLVFFMGDSPFYTPQNNYYLSCLQHADLVLSPDTLWEEQLNTMGLNRTLWFIPGVDEKSYFKIRQPEMLQDEKETGVLYVGSCYLNSWGYKKALLMNSFTGFRFSLYGNSAWRRWFPFFPALEEHFTEGGFIPQERLNRMYNRTRIIPVDGNPGIINGVHLRMFEALAAGALPLIEHRKDVDSRLFRGFTGELPVIRDYSHAADTASAYLADEPGRQQLAEAMHGFLIREYSSALNAERLAEALR
jgi:hypothetical protein